MILDTHAMSTFFSFTKLGMIGKLLDPFMTLPPGLLPSLLGIGHYIRQAPKVLLGHLSSLAHLRKLALEKGNSLSEALSLPVSRGQRCSAPRLHS
jgi:hypothetical protein